MIYSTLKLVANVKLVGVDDKGEHYGLGANTKGTI
jgi:hypothetical protein